MRGRGTRVRQDDTAPHFGVNNVPGKGTDLVKAVLAYLKIAHPRGVWWPANVGAVQVGKRFVRFGVPGMSDIQGVFASTDGGHWHGRAVFVECKAAKGKQSPAQKVFQDAVEAAGGLYILAYEIGDVERAL